MDYELDETENEKKAQDKLLARNFSFGIGSKVFYMATRLFLPPLTLVFVSLEEYGIWASCFIIVGYLGMSAFGVTNVYIRYTAEYAARNENEKISELLSSGLAVTISISLLLLAGLWFGLPYIITLFKISPDLRRTAFVLFFSVSATFLFDLTFGAFAYVLHGLQEIAAQTKVWIFTFCLEAVLIVAFLFAGFGIYALLIAFVLRYLVATVAYVVICRRYLPTLKISPKLIRRDALKLFYGYGAVVQFNGLLSMILYSSEKVIAGSLLGVRATGLFDIGEKFPVMASQVTSSMNTALLPAMSNMQSRKWRAEVSRVYIESSRLQSVLTGLMMGFLCAFAAPLITIWMGAKEEIVLGAAIMSIFTVPYQLNGLTGPASAFHRGANRPSRETIYPVSQIVMLALIVPSGIFFFGTSVLTIAYTVAASMILSSLFYIFYSNRFIEVAPKNYILGVLLPGILPYFTGFAVFLAARPALESFAANRLILFGAAAFAGFLYLAFNILVFYKFARPDERRKINAFADKIIEKVYLKKVDRFAAQIEKI